MPLSLELFATAPRGTADLLAAELRALGAETSGERGSGVYFTGSLESALKVCLWSRFAGRVLLLLGQGPATDADSLYESVQGVDWSAHLAPGATLAVDFHGRSTGLQHSVYGARRVKDAVVDQLRQRHGWRPDVDLREPDLRINVHLERERARIALDLSGESLHRRGYRVAPVEAPLKEHLAAALLARAGWPAIARAGGALHDLLCGSATLPLEAALMAADSAPGLTRPRFGFERWPQHQPELWRRLRAEATGRREAGLDGLPDIRGFDADPAAVRAALANIEAAGLRGRVHVERRELGDARSRAGPGSPSGLVVANPPYGRRLGEARELEPLYARLGEALRGGYDGWEAAVLTATPALGHCLGLRARRSHTLWNGALECRLLRFTLREPWLAPVPANRVQRAQRRVMAHGEAQPGADMIANRLRKNRRERERWAAREKVDCYRLYDADMPEYAAAIDLYHTEQGERWVHVQEYRAPPTVEAEAARRRLDQLLAVLPEVLEVDAERVVCKRRERQRGRTQYDRLGAGGGYLEVREGPARLLVNLTDHLDTGLFLDHRPTRALLGRLAAGKRFLNLFCYTGSATVHAALGGARESVSVDSSASYLEWAGRNLDRNGLPAARHRLQRDDCMRWLRSAAGGPHYDLIFLDPPSFSNSRRSNEVLDVQRDHAALIQAAAALLAPGGLLLFSTNLRRFRLDADALQALETEDISAASIPHDFRRNPRIHQCWRLWAREGAGPGAQAR